MVRFRSSRRRQSMLSPWVKNVLQIQTVGQVAGTPLSLQLAKADNGTDDDSTSFPALIKAMYFDLTILSSAGVTAGQRIAYALWFDPADVLVNTASTITMDPQFKRQAWFMGQGQPGGQGVGVPYRIVGWIKIPKKYQLLQENDAIRFNIEGALAAFDICGLVIYRWRT